MKRVFFALLLWAFCTSVGAQQSSVWNRIENLQKAGSYNLAYGVADSVAQQCLKQKHWRAALRATLLMSQSARYFQENYADSSLRRFNGLLSELTGAEKALCHAFMAQIYSAYYDQHLYEISRNEPSDNPDLDFPLWSESRFDSVINYHIEASLSDAVLLQKTDIRLVAEFCDTVADALLLTTPTLYDMLVYNAVENGHYPDRQKLERLASLQKFHASDDECLRIYVDLQYLDAVHAISYSVSELPRTQVPDGPQLCRQLIEQYRGTNCELAADFYLWMAQKYNIEGLFVEAVTYCDSALALFPNSSGACQCANLRARIMRPEVSMEIETAQIPEHDILATMEYKNIDKVYFRIVKVSRKKVFSGGAFESVSDKPVREWEVSVPNSGDYKSAETYVYINGLAPGYYWIYASPSPNFVDSGFVARHVLCCDAQIVPTPDGYSEGYMMSRLTGKPIVGQKIKCEIQVGSKKKTKTSVTNETGFYSFADFVRQGGDANFSFRYQGVEIEEDDYCNYSDSRKRPYREVMIYYDRPIYRPGDTLQFALLCISGDGRWQGEALANQQLFCVLKDFNGKAFDTVVLHSDALGGAHGSFTLSQHALPGEYYVSVTMYDAQGHNEFRQIGYFTVEQYKQPKFMVSLSADKRSHRLGDSVRVEGIAASYSAAPIGGAKVRWSVTRGVPWRWYINHSVSKSSTIASGTTTTDNQGKFVVDYVLVADSLNNLRHERVYAYELVVDVTDVNGETHTSQQVLWAGNVGGYVSIVMKDDTGYDDDFSKVKYCYKNLDDQPIDGKLQIKVEKLKMPRQPYLQHSLFDPNTPHQISESDFRDRYPLLAYHPADIDPACWQVEQIAFAAELQASAAMNVNEVSLPHLPEGVYRVWIYTVDSLGDTLQDTKYVCFTPRNAEHAQTVELLWSDVNSDVRQMGDTLLLRVGSRFRDVTAYLSVMAGDSVILRRVLQIDDDLTTLRIPVTEAMRGGFSINLLSVKENVPVHRSHAIKVPYTDKLLKMEWHTFRDKLEPGGVETWKIKVSQPDAVPSKESAVLLTMYDDALNTYLSLRWIDNVWLPNSRKYDLLWREFLFQSYVSHFPPLEYVKYSGKAPQEFRLKNYFDRFASPLYYSGSARGEDGMVTTNSGTYPKSAKMSMDESYVMEAESVVATVAGVGFSDGSVQRDEPLEVMEAVVLTEEESNDAVQTDAIVHSERTQLQIRKNLSTLACFYPALRTDSSGVATFTFRVPESLTRWDLHALAWNSSLQMGSLQATTVTQKKLMVVPNVPRFLRHGDTIDFSVKTMNLTDSVQYVELALDIMDPVTQTTISSQCTTLTLNPQTNMPASFSVSVPDSFYVVTYRVVAVGQGCSDGEQADIPVLSNRQLITESLAMYLNGSGSKKYQLPHLVNMNLQSGTQSLRPHALIVACSPNPIWYAVQSIPYVASRPNPSNIYRFNALYANSVAAYVVAKNPQIEKQFRLWEQQSDSNTLRSQLLKNEEATQTLILETPWYRDAMDENVRNRQVANYFDTKSLQSQRAEHLDKLLADQHSDGGWSWMPKGSYASQYITQYILKSDGRLQRLVGNFMLPKQARKKALDYIDRKTYDYYRKFVKKNLDCEIDNIDYLYTRTFYLDIAFRGNAKQAYDYYYGTALKHKNKFTDLYSQAQLALVFYRNGDKDAAKQMITRIKGRALYSDEMGMYWRDNCGGYFWNQRPIEVQSLLIEAFSTVTPNDKESVAKMQQWLLKQRQTTSWESDVATANAVAALLMSPSEQLTNGANAVTIKVGNHEVRQRDTVSISFSERWTSEDISPDMGKVTLSKTTNGIAWASLCWQYFEDLDKVQYNEMGVKLQKQLYKINPDGSLSLFNAKTMSLNVGDRVRVRLLIDCDRTLEYVELKDQRAAAFEPISTQSGWCWNGGLSYFVSVDNAATSFFIDCIEKGKYVLEYDLWVNASGSFSNGIATLQCLYAPEFRTNTAGCRISIQP